MKITQHVAHSTQRHSEARQQLVTLATLLWVALAALVMITVVVTSARAFSLIATPCTIDEVCSIPRLFPAHTALLAGYGIGPTGYALLIVGLWALIALGGALVGGVIVWHARADRSAMLGAYTLLVYGIANTPLLLAGGGPAWGWSLAATGTWIIGDAVLIYFCALFPTGEFVPRAIRWIMPVLIAFDIALAVYANTAPSTFNATMTLYVGIVGWMAILVGAQLYRYRYAASAVERQQTQAIVVALVLCLVVRHVIAFISLVLLHGASPADLFGVRLLVRLLDSALNLLLPLLFGVAILRRRLYNIEVAINRAVVYGLLTGCVVALYMLLVGGMSVLLHSNDNLWISLLATGVIAVVFQPLRTRLQRGVNRLLYGERDEPYAVLARLGQQLQAAAGTDAVLPSVVNTVRDAFKLPYVAVTVWQDNALVPAATSGTPLDSARVVIPLRYQHAEIGQLVLGLRGANDPFSPADERLLHDLARQIGIALHAVRLASDLQHSRERLVTAREEERRRLRRDLHDGLGPTLASLTMQVDTARALVDDDPATVAVLLANVQSEMKTTIGTVRQLVYALRPPALDQLGLLAAIREHAARTLATHGIVARFDLPETLPTLPAAVEVAAYYIVVEATTNVVRHAEAQRCTIALTLTPNTLELTVTDDGAGLPEARSGGVGLATMRERAEELGGTCAVAALPPQGTQVRATMPWSS